MRSSRVRELFAVLTVAVMVLLSFSFALTGEHVCHRVENYTVTSREQYVEPVEIHTLAWCLQIPPRCPQTRTELRERWRMKTEVKFKSVAVCCEGYIVQELVGNEGVDAKCMPYCKKCHSGVCTAPNECTCSPGFQGQDCAFECPQGTWGQSCKNECNCLREVACNPISGKCKCPDGWMGFRCENKCPRGQWGTACNSICLCENPLARCHHETGECIEPNDNSLIDPFEASDISINLILTTTTAKVVNTDYFEVIDYDKEAILPRVTEQTTVVPSLSEEMILIQSDPITKGLSIKTIEEKPITHRPTGSLPTKSTSIEGNQLSQPDNLKKSNFDFDNRQSNFRVIASPKNDYVKTTYKVESGTSMSAIPIDIAAMIVVGAIVSIGLTSVAALIFHLRSRLLKAALSIYNQEKIERHFTEKDDICEKELDETIGTLTSRSMTRENPVFIASSDMNSATLRFDDRSAEYTNGTVPIGIRLSSNLRDLLESQYDRPASCSHRSATMGEMDVEHVYDEIPFMPPFHFENDT